MSGLAPSGHYPTGPLKITHGRKRHASKCRRMSHAHRRVTLEENDFE
jgi:hypothetical protein